MTKFQETLDHAVLCAKAVDEIRVAHEFMDSQQEVDAPDPVVGDEKVTSMEGVEDLLDDLCKVVGFRSYWYDDPHDVKVDEMRVVLSHDPYVEIRANEFGAKAKLRMLPADARIMSVHLDARLQEAIEWLTDWVADNRWQ